ncbi:MAG: TetR/AcrR family transcriptional regulator [Pseudomonadales bacterium]
MNKPNDQRALKTRHALFEASIKELLANPSATMSEIANSAGIGRATLYRHFETRELLVRALAQLCLEETDQALKHAYQFQGRAALEAIFTAIMPLANRFRFLMSLWQIAARDPEVTRIYQRQLRDLKGTVLKAQKRAELRNDIPADWIVASFDAQLNVAWHMVETRVISAGEAEAYFRTTFFSGCEVCSPPN